MAFVAFGLGAFPLQTLQTAIGQAASKKAGIELGSSEQSELLKLNGVDKPLAERLINEDISSIVQLAYCDPVQLTMRTNLSFNGVVDLVSQALAWIYLEDKLSLIRSIGFRGAYEIRDYRDGLLTGDDKERLEKLRPIIIERLGMPGEAVDYVFWQIANDPYTTFICETWS